MDATFHRYIENLEYIQRQSIRMVNCHMKKASHTRKSLVWRRKTKHRRADCYGSCSRKEAGTRMGVSDRKQISAHI